MTKKKRKPSAILGCLPLVIAIAGIIYGLRWYVQRQEERSPFKSKWNQAQAGADAYRAQVVANVSLNVRESGRVFVGGTLSNRGTRNLTYVHARVHYRSMPGNVAATANVNLGAIRAKTTRKISVRLPRANAESVSGGSGVSRVEVYSVVLEN